MGGRAHMQAGKAELTSAGGARLQRKCVCGGSCASCGAEKKRLQRAARSGSGPQGTTVPAVVHEVLATPGQALSPSARAFMEPRFRHDFSKVRVHTDTRAAESARAVDALAYTVGQHIAFDHGQYQPDTQRGRHLLAHELAHTVQQGDVSGPAVQALTFESPGSSALEQQAEAMATAVASEGTAAPLSSVQAGPVLSRARRNWQGPTAIGNVSINSSLGAHQVLAQDQSPVSASANAPIALQIDKLYLPRAKEPFLRKYQTRAWSGELEAVMGRSAQGDTRPALKQARDGLWDTWLRKVGWPSRNINCWQSAIESAMPLEDKKHVKTLNFRQVPNGSWCQADHMIELQLLGTNVEENIIPLEEGNNSQAGRLIFDQLKSLYDGIQGQLSSPVADVILSFKSVELGGPPAANANDQCVTVHGHAPRVAGTCTGNPAAGGTDPTGNTYIIYAGAASATIDPAPPGQLTPLEGTGVSATNKNSRQLVPGLILTSLDRRRQGSLNDLVTARLDARRSSRLPAYLTAAINSQSQPVVFKVDSQQRLKHLSPPLPELTFTYPFLSEGKLKLSYGDASGLTGKGKLTPSVPLLKRAPIDVAADFNKDEFAGAINVTPEKLTLPPGLRITQSTLGIDLAPEFHPYGLIAFEAGPQGRPVLTGSVEAAHENGFVARGQLNAHLPGVDQARGTVEYRDNQWSGDVNIQATQLRLPFMKSGALRVTFTGDSYSVSGSVVAEAPGGSLVELSAQLDKQRGWTYQGQGTFELPGLAPASVSLIHDGTKLTGSGKVPVNLLGLNGSLQVDYLDGALTGSGALHYKRGDFSGTLKANLSKERRLSGEGTFSYSLTKGLVGTVGVVLGEDQSLRVKGALQFSKPVTLFNRFENSRVLFSRSLDIPIIGVSLGPVSVGLIARITGTLSSGYGIGAATLSNITLTTAFNPLEANPNPDLSMAATLDIPASAELTLSVRGALGASAAVASITGGVTLAGSAALQGGLHAPLSLRYQAGRLLVSAQPSITTALVLGLQVGADVIGEAGVLGLTYSKRWAWDLASFQWNSGLRFGLIAPLSYDSAKGFTPPAASQIQWIIPNIDLTQLVKNMVDRARATSERSR